MKRYYQRARPAQSGHPIRVSRYISGVTERTGIPGRRWDQSRSRQIVLALLLIVDNSRVEEIVPRQDWQNIRFGQA